MLHIGTTEPGHVTLFEQARDTLSGYLAEQRARAQKRQVRAALRRLTELDDHTLADIGFSRGQVQAMVERRPEAGAKAPQQSAA